MSSTIIDDRDLSRVNYTGSWLAGGSAGDHDKTSTSSTKAGDYFTVRFSGNSITVYGTIDITSGGVVTNYSIDNATPEQVTSQTGSGNTYNQQFWRSPTLDVGEHNLVVTMVKVNNNPQPGEGTIWFDYFLAVDPTIRAQESAHRKHVGAIIGGVIGGVLALLLFILAFIFHRRRRQQKRESVHVQPIYWPKNEINSDSPTPFMIRDFTTDQTAVEPFILGSNLLHASSSPSSLSSPTSSELPRKSAIMDQSRRHTFAHSTQPSLATTSTSHDSSSSPHPGTSQNAVTKQRRRASIHESSATTASSPSSSQPLQHVDSGVRAINIGTSDVPTASIELPPVYSPV